MHFWDQHKTITRYYEILMSSVCEKYQLKHLEYDILMFLHKIPSIARRQISSGSGNPPSPTCPPH